MNASETKHTPGPWGYEDPMGPDILTIVANPSDPAYEWIWVAQIGTAVIEDDDGKVIDQRPFWEHEANARLIAAAPDMLEALRRHMAAVKALGEFEDGKTLFEGSPTHSQRCFKAWTELDAAGKQAAAAIAKAEGSTP